MGCRGSSGSPPFSDAGYGTSATSSPDYNLSELVRAMNLKYGKIEPPSTPSPPMDISTSPNTLFGQNHAEYRNNGLNFNTVQLFLWTTLPLICIFDQC